MKRDITAGVILKIKIYRKGVINMTNKKVIVIGIDGMDPRLTRKYIDEGRMPATKKLLELGSARHDLSMLGGHPCITPPMWTTMATGCYANVHGITDYYRNVPEGHEYQGYNLDSRFCRAEQLWNVTAEAGLKTLVYHWPGSSWPPTSDSPNLHVIDGTQPAVLNMGVAQVEEEFIIQANVKTTELIFKEKASSDGNIPCVTTGLKLSEEAKASVALHDDTLNLSLDGSSMLFLPLNDAEGCMILSEYPFNVVLSPLQDAKDWINAPEDAREFTLLLSGGLIRRPSLILKNDQGIYDRVAIYKSKKDEEPIIVLENNVFTPEVIDKAYVDDKFVTVNRNMRVLNIDPNGNSVKMWVSAAMKNDVDILFHPRRLYKIITENVGFPPPACNIGAGDEQLIRDCMIKNWDYTMQWTADAILTLLEEEDYQVVFTQAHNIDALGHMLLRYLKERENSKLPAELYQELFARGYEDTDKYIARFLPLLDDGWDIILLSDHAQVTSENEKPYFAGTGILYELGYTALVKDEKGNPIKKIDWEHTTAIANRNGHIYINLKGREPHGIVDPADKYELEEKLMTDLYGYKDKKTGYRVVSLALRNKDAVHFGMGGEWPQEGDIVFFDAEGYNTDHGDSLSTTYGCADTSVGPIFIAAGPSFKKNFETKRIIRQIDVTPTMAQILNVRMPNECEGAPVYQILK